MTALAVVKLAIREEWADGLFNPSAGCACLLPDISPDGCMTEECTIGFRRDCTVCGQMYMSSSGDHPGGPCPECEDGSTLGS